MPSPTPSPARFAALDAFRGASVALMILVNNPGSWAHLYGPLAHAPWHGVTPTDLVFPFFLFAVGNALAFVLPALRDRPPSEFWRRVLRRTALIFLIGVLLNWAPFLRWDAAGDLVARPFETLRLMGVLQRIALCFGAAAVIVWLAGPEPRHARRRVLWTGALLLLGYWAACLAWGQPGDPYSLGGWFGTRWDIALLGQAHLYRGEGVPFDPEGLASTVPAVVNVLLGWWAGDLIVQARRRVNAELLLRLFVAGALLLALAWLWQLQMPLNKKIWTSSYVLHGSGLALIALVLFMRAEQAGASPAATAPGRGGQALWRGVSGFFEVFGRNPLFIFVLSGLVPRLLGLWRWPAGTAADGTPLWTTPLPWLYRHLFAGLGQGWGFDERLGSLAFALANLLLYAALAWWLDRRRIYIKV